MSIQTVGHINWVKFIGNSHGVVTGRDTSHSVNRDSVAFLTPHSIHQTAKPLPVKS